MTARYNISSGPPNNSCSAEYPPGKGLPIGRVRTIASRLTGGIPGGERDGRTHRITPKLRKPGTGMPQSARKSRPMYTSLLSISQRNFTLTRSGCFQECSSSNVLLYLPLLPPPPPPTPLLRPSPAGAAMREKRPLAFALMPSANGGAGTPPVPAALTAVLPAFRSWFMLRAAYAR